MKEVGSAVDEVWAQLGSFGRYTRIHYALLLVPCYLYGMYGSVYNFEAMDINYRCKVPQCEGINETLWLEYAIPKENNKLSKCNRYRFFNETDECDLKGFSGEIISCDSYVYNGVDSVVKDFDLGCQNWKRTLIGTMYGAGFFLSLTTTGILSDKYGRIKALAVASFSSGVFGLIRSFSMNYEMLIATEFLETAFGAGAYNAAFVLGMELVQPKGRVLGNTLINFAYISGSMSLSLLAWYLQNWRYLLRTIYTPAIFIITYLFVLNENPRWLLSKGRYEEALVVIKKAETMNKVKIREEVLTSLKAGTNQKEIEAHESFLPVLRKMLGSKIIALRVLLCCYLWMTCSFTYYGLSINSVFLAGNKYLNFSLVAFVEIPANFVCLMILDKFGRKKVLVTVYMLSAIFCMSLSFIPEDLSIWRLVFYLCGKFSITIAYSTVYVTVSEVFPTNARQSLLAFCATTGRIGSTLAPQTPLLALYYVNLPTIFFACVALLASMLALTLPETINKTLPDNLEEAKSFS
ncbi:solute carrier family 22 member 5 [Pieris rapae]|uniref:solute carrier family 22 member 5 n=1 Tax=Pieris rapae TaxID=64459 RepID=UPI001E27A8AE|nr:solute carrier family 22 member 5 [Pieris rapae]